MPARYMQKQQVQSGRVDTRAWSWRTGVLGRFIWGALRSYDAQAPPSRDSGFIGLESAHAREFSNNPPGNSNVELVLRITIINER